MNNILLDQCGHLAGATGFDCTTLYRIDGTEFAGILKPGPVEEKNFLLVKSQIPAGLEGTGGAGEGWRENAWLSSAGAFRKMNPSSGQRRQLVFTGRFWGPAQERHVDSE
jgi:hypothetical protein